MGFTLRNLKFTVMGKHSKLVRLIWAFPSLVWAGQAVGQDRAIDLVRDNKINQDYRLPGRTAAHTLAGSLIEWRWLVSYADYWKGHNENKGARIWGENNLCTNRGDPGKCWPGASESTDAGRSCYLDISYFNPPSRSYLQAKIDELEYNVFSLLPILDPVDMFKVSWIWTLMRSSVTEPS